MSKSVLFRRTSLGKLIIRLGMAIVILLIPVSSYSLPYQSPRTQNVEQTNVPDYISQAEAGVKKYYPQYEEYFKGIIKEIKGLGDYEQYLFNKETNRNLLNAGGLLKNEKEIITTLLVSMEKVHGIEDFKKKIGISEDSNINDVSNDIINGFTRKYEKITKELDNFKQDINKLNTKADTQGIISTTDEYITTSEKYMSTLKDVFINYGLFYKSKDVQYWIKLYIEILNKSGKTPNKIGQRYIDEYNKINKK